MNYHFIMTQLLSRLGKLLSLLLFPIFLSAQTGTIAGKVIDAKSSEGLIGCSIRLVSGTGGAITDFDGNFVIQNVPVGVHIIEVRYTGYQDKKVESIEVKGGEATTIDLALEEPSAGGTAITEVLIVATAKRESMSALTILQKNSPVIADGISAETIKRTPDRTTGDVIKRVSGASIQDGRFAVIRGLNDRYNVAMVNGALLGSTEPDRRAFSFDIFPSALLDNLIILKTASPDLPGEFAGGAIVMNTKDIPEQSYLNVSVNGSYNGLTTFNAYQAAQGGGTDWLGFDDGTRALPASFPATTAEYTRLPIDRRSAIAKDFKNNWATESKNSARPGFGVQITGGLLKEFNERSRLGATVGVTYNNSPRFQRIRRLDFDLTGQLFDFDATQYNFSVLSGLLTNIGYTINPKNKIVFQSSYTNNSDNNVFIRRGIEIPEGFEQRSEATEFAQTGLLSTRLSGDHSFGQKGYKLGWGFGVNQTERDAPDQRRILQRRGLDGAGLPNEREAFTMSMPPRGAPYTLGRISLNLQERVVNGNVDFTIPFALANDKQNFKVGMLYQGKDREFSGRLLGVIRNEIRLPGGLLQQPIDQIFRPENFNPDVFGIDDITNLSDSYDADAALVAGYGMFQNTFGKLKATWGIRAENFVQNLNSFRPDGSPVRVGTDTLVFLPSLNLTYALSEKSNLRFSASQTASRPEFREIAPFVYFDFATQTLIQGNPALNVASIYNFDVRYEIYPGSNQLFSVSAFYKYFNNPIEQVLLAIGSTTRLRSYSNVPSAQNFGVELEGRKNFGFINEKLEDLVAFANVALVQSRLDLSTVNAGNPDRPLQGQSPYVVNGGLTANMRDIGLNATLVYNVVGDRVFEVGALNYDEVYERHRHVIDFQLSKKIGKHAEVKLNWQDMLAQDFIFYQDNNRDKRYQKPANGVGGIVGQDNLIQVIDVASTVGLTFSYRF
jgi:TonB-dependent receptor